MSSAPPSLVIAGQLRREYILPAEGKPLLDSPGGSALYAAVGALVWETPSGLLARIGENYPREWLRQWQALSLDTQGIKILPSELETRSFVAYTEGLTPQRGNPISHFLRLGLPFPKSLLGYNAALQEAPSATFQAPDSPRLLDIPSIYHQASGVHITGLDFATQMQLVTAFRQAGVRTVTLEPNPASMNGNFLTPLCSLLQGLTAFLPSEEDLRSLFWGRSSDLLQMLTTLGGFGVNYIVVKRGARGQLLYESATQRAWEIAAYPAQLRDPTHTGDVFCGGFLAAYTQTLDALQATLQGNVSASLAIEGSGAFYALQALPGLAQARLHFLKDLVKAL